MNQIMTGRFIALKRKEKNLTQEQLAEKLGISNKTVSKWENGRCMPDYSIVKPLCKELEITVAELLDGETRENGGSAFDEQRMLEILERIQKLEKQKETMYGMLLAVMGVAFMAVSQFIGGTALRDFISGLFLGLSIAQMLVGVYVMGRSFGRQ